VALRAVLAKALNFVRAPTTHATPMPKNGDADDLFYQSKSGRCRKARVDIVSRSSYGNYSKIYTDFLTLASRIAPDFART